MIIYTDGQDAAVTVGSNGQPLDDVQLSLLASQMDDFAAWQTDQQNNLDCGDDINTGACVNNSAHLHAGTLPPMFAQAPHTAPGQITPDMQLDLATVFARYVKDVGPKNPSVLLNMLNSDIVQEYAASLGNLSACFWDADASEDGTQGWLGSTGYQGVVDALIDTAGLNQSIRLGQVRVGQWLVTPAHHFHVSRR